MRTAGLLLLYAAALTLGLSQTFGPTFRSGFEHVQTESGDGMLNHYILEHSWQAVANPEYCGSLFSPPCFFPARKTLWYSEHLLGVAPVYWALHVALPYDLAYQWWQIVLAALNFVAFAAVVRWLRCPHALALLGGYLWGFALVHVDQIKHQQLIARFMMPLAAYHAWMFVLAVGSAPANPTRHLNRMLAAVFVQAVTCVNSAWFLVTGLATFVPLALILRPGGVRDRVEFLAQNRGRAARIVGVWALALLITYLPYLVVNWGQKRTYEECIGLIPTPSAWVTGLPGTMWNETLSPYRGHVMHECQLFCGFGLYALGLAVVGYLLATARRKDRSPEYAVIAAALITALIWAALAFTPESRAWSPWKFVRHIPGGTAIRCVSRVYLLVYLFGTLAALVWLARVTENLRRPVRLAVLGAVAAWCVVEQLGSDPPRFPKQDFYPIADRVAADLGRGDIGYVYPRYTDTEKVTSFGLYGDILAMWAGLRANVPVVNGYSGRVPDRAFLPFSWIELEPGQNPLPSVLNWLRERRFRGRLVLIDPDHPTATRVIVID